MRTLGPGDRHPSLERVKRKLGLYPADDLYTHELAARIRGLQMGWGSEPTGFLDRKTLERFIR